MAKLYFKYGVVNSSKSANALMTIHNYEEQGMHVFVIKSVVDTRDGGFVKSRALADTREADIVVTYSDDLYKILSGITADVIIIDECQFLEDRQIDDLRRIANDTGIPVICYGLKTDFLTHLFPSSKRLLELADSIQEIKTVCRCGRKAIFNARIDETGKVVKTGDVIKVGGNELYRPVCSECYYRS